MNYRQQLENKKLEEIIKFERWIKENEDANVKYTKTIQRLKLEEPEVEELKRLLTIDINNMLEKHEYNKYKDSGGSWGDDPWEYDKYIKIDMYVIDGKITREVEFYKYDTFGFGGECLEKTFEILTNGKKETEKFIEKYQPIIDKIYDMSEKDNYARTFNEYLEEVENELQTTIRKRKT